MNAPSHRGSFGFAVALRSDVGKVRSENQDFGLVTSPDSWDPAEGILMLVADGMGGHRGGATASRLAASTIEQDFLAARDGDTASALLRAIERANGAVFEESRRNAELRGMGTTVSALVVRHGCAWLAHVGDSRIYLLREGKLHQLTEDHSLVATMVKEKLITPEEAAVHPRRNVLQRSLGVATEVEVDHRDGIDVQDGDTFLLCSDGLHGFVALDRIREALDLPVDQAADRCVELAHAAGAPDNVTVIVCRAESADGPKGAAEATVEIPVGVATGSSSRV
ncbi:MAG: Stp1/IreP family PP2C-type Ser/Thr phosphatase [Thermoanaerobaculia bacterium]